MVTHALTYLSCMYKRHDQCSFGSTIAGHATGDIALVAPSPTSLNSMFILSKTLDKFSYHILLIIHAYNTGIS
jgi:hypothetical protein